MFAAVRCSWLTSHAGNRPSRVVVLAAVVGALVATAPASTRSAQLAENSGGYQVELLAAAPTNQSQVVAIADYYDKGYSNRCDSTGEYVLKSADGGQTWQVSAELSDAVSRPCSGLLNVASVDDGETLLAISNKGDIVRSGDAGKTWVVVQKHVTAWTKWPDNLGGTPLIADPARPGSAWVCSALNEASAASQTTGVLSTTDGGRTWQAHKVRTVANANGSCAGLAVQPGGTVLLAYGDTSVPSGKGSWKNTGSQYKLFRSSDRGTHWRRVPDVSCGTAFGYSPLPSCWAQAVMLGGGVVFFDQAQPNVAIGRSSGESDHGGLVPGAESVIYRSSDAGIHWTPVALVASLQNHGPGRIYKGSEFHLALSAGKWQFVDSLGRRLFPRLGPAGFFDVGGTLLSFNNNRYGPDATIIQSSNRGLGWSLGKYSVVKSTSGAYSPADGIQVNNGELLALDGNTTPSILWRYQPSGRIWNEESLNLPDALEPTSGHWLSGDRVVDFYVSNDHSVINRFTFQNSNSVNSCTIGTSFVTDGFPIVRDPIAGSSFSHTDASASVSGVFDSATSAHGTVEQKGTSSCGAWDTGKLAWTASWRDSSQPSS